MTAEAKNKIIGVLHLILGALALLSTIAAIIFVFVITSAIAKQPAPPGAPSPILFAAIMLVATLLFAALFGGTAFVAGFGLLKRKSWARNAGMISSAFAMLNFPLGTAIGFYSFWFFLSNEGKQFYHSNKII